MHLTPGVAKFLNLHDHEINYGTLSNLKSKWDVRFPKKTARASSCLSLLMGTRPSFVITSMILHSWLARGPLWCDIHESSFLVDRRLPFGVTSVRLRMKKGWCHKASAHFSTHVLQQSVCTLKSLHHNYNNLHFLFDIQHLGFIMKSLKKML